MVTYALGNIAAKRRAFRAAANFDTVYVDNDEVAATFTLDKRLYVVSGAIPYGNMNLEQYVVCSRALKTNLPMSRDAVKELLAMAGITGKSTRRLKRLSRVEYRAASLAKCLDENTERIFINFDGMNFTRKNERTLAKFVKVWAKRYEVFVAVSDSRFVPEGAPVITYSTDNTFANTTAHPKKIRMSVLLRRLRKTGMDLKLPGFYGVLSVIEQ